MSSSAFSGATIVGVVPEALRAEFFSSESTQSLENSALKLGGSLVWLESSAQFDEFCESSEASSAIVAISSWGFPFLDSGYLSRLKGLKLLAHTGATVRPFVGEEFFGSGCAVTQAGDAMGRPVAEVALAFTMSLLHQTHRFSIDLHLGKEYEESQTSARPQREILGAKIGVVGASRTGRQYIEMAKALGADVLVYDPFVSVEEAARLGVTKLELADLMSRSQIVAVHAPSLPETHHMIDAEMLALMPDGSGLVNTARSWLVDESALLEQARSGRIDVALDVYDREPFGLEFGFRGLSNVILTPHRAAGSVEGRLRGGQIVSQEVARFVRGEQLENSLTMADLERMA